MKEHILPSFGRLNNGEIVPAKDLLEEDPTAGSFLMTLVINGVITMACDAKEGLQVRLSDKKPELDYEIFHQ